MSELKDIRFLNSHDALKKYYNNARYNIEDPLFTGFTLDIDKDHSPLFSSVVDDFTDETLVDPDAVSTPLADRFENGLKLMYDNFKFAPDNYGITTLDAKNPFSADNRRRPGYGIWENAYIDAIPYGAVDYIYMVDKTTMGTYEDGPGTVDIGNGSPSSNIYEDFLHHLPNDEEREIQIQSTESQMNDNTVPNLNEDVFFDNDITEIRSDQKSTLDEIIKFMKDNPESTVQVDGYASNDRIATDEHNMGLSIGRAENVKAYFAEHGIDPSRINTSYFGDQVQPFDKLDDNRAVRCYVTGKMSSQSILNKKIEQNKKIMDEKESEHENNVNAFKEIDDVYQEKLKQYNEKKKELSGIDDSIENGIMSIKYEFNYYQTQMSTYEEQLKNCIVENKQKEYINKINDIYNQYIQFVDYFISNKDLNNQTEITENKYQYIQIKKGTEKFLRETENFDNEVKELTNELEKNNNFNNDIVNAYKKIWAVTKSRLGTISVPSETNDKRREISGQISILEKELFGVDNEGRPGTLNSPKEGSLGYEHRQAENTVNNDEYSQAERDNFMKEDTLKNLEDTEMYQKYKNERDSTRRNIPPLPSSDVDKVTIVDRAKYEVPQTVLDMIGFINGMDKITKEYPYVFQTISGLDEAYNKYFTVKDPYMGSGDGKISIECLDFLDLRVSSMFNKYFNAAYDRQYRRERVPINLRRFKCSIFVHDIRNFEAALGLNSLDDFEYITNITKVALNSLSAIEFKFFDCEIVPEETGNIFDNVSNVDAGDMRKTKFTFTYGNCIINFLPFDDLRRYMMGNKDNSEIKYNKDYEVKRNILESKRDLAEFKDEYEQVVSSSSIIRRDENGNISKVDDDIEMKGMYNQLRNVDDTNFRRWFDKSVLGNVSNNDYREYIRHDASVVVDDHYKTKIVNDFALGSVVNKNEELTAMNDALRKIVVGISASTGIPVKGVTDALNIKFIDPIINGKDLDVAVVKNIGNVNNSKVVDEHTMEYIGKVVGEEEQETEVTQDLGNVNNKQKGGN